MFDIEVPFRPSGGFYKIDSTKNKPLDRPFHLSRFSYDEIDHTEYMIYYTLDDDLHQWFKDNNIFYIVVFKNGRFWISFKSIEEIVLFKLVWG